MAGASMKDIKLRVKSVQSTMQITKAMELVASSKLRRAKENAERRRPFFDILHETLTDIAVSNRDFSSPYLVQRPVKKSCYVVIARNVRCCPLEKNQLSIFHGMGMSLSASSMPRLKVWGTTNVRILHLC